MAGYAGRGPPLALAEWGLIHVAKLEHVGNVVRRRSAVPGEHARSIPAEGRPVAIVCYVYGMGVGVSALQEQSASDPPINRGLQRVVSAVSAAVPFASCRGAPDFGKQRAGGIA